LRNAREDQCRILEQEIRLAVCRLDHAVDNDSTPAYGPYVLPHTDLAELWTTGHFTGASTVLEGAGGDFLAAWFETGRGPTMGALGAQGRKQMRTAPEMGVQVRDLCTKTLSTQKHNVFTPGAEGARRTAGGSGCPLDREGQQRLRGIVGESSSRLQTT